MLQRLYFLIILATIVGTFSSGANAQNHVLWASTGAANQDGGGRIYVIFPNSKTVRFIGNTGLDRTGALAFDNNGNLYTVANGSGGPADLYMVDKANASVTFVGTTPNGQIDGIAFDSSGTLFAANCCSDLFTLNPTTAAVITSVPLTGSGNSFVAGLAFDPSDQLFGSRGNAGGRLDDFVSINTNTGVMTAIGGMTNVISDIWFADDGTLYGGSPTGDLFIINPITGAQTFLFNTGIRISGLTGGENIPARTIPTLSEWGLIAIAGVLGIIGFIAIRRRKVTA